MSLLLLLGSWQYVLTAIGPSTPMPIEVGSASTAPSDAGRRLIEFAAPRSGPPTARARLRPVIRLVGRSRLDGARSTICAGIETIPSRMAGYVAAPAITVGSQPGVSGGTTARSSAIHGPASGFPTIPIAHASYVRRRSCMRSVSTGMAAAQHNALTPLVWSPHTA